ncbi:hypothetical protein Mapa_013799 [Marchantia paleacea]|nr:hypothetical protein Mapa_013799 [Marchantia paleacea]
MKVNTSKKSKFTRFTAISKRRRPAPRFLDRTHGPPGLHICDSAGQTTEKPINQIAILYS